MNTNKKGFTLIELLIVIVIIGILAAAVITAINPVEQIKKANDSGKMATANELVNAINVYYVANLVYPWGTDTIPAPGSDGTALSGVTWIADPLASSADIKETLANRNFTGLKVWLGSDGGVMICFPPESESYKLRAVYDGTADTPTGEGTATMLCVK